MLGDCVAVVTGGALGIGRRIALRLARDGARLVVASPEPEELASTAGEIGQLGVESIAVVTDVTDEVQVSAMVATALERFGRVDLLVNNAGIEGPTAPVVEVDRSAWDAVLAVNLTGPYLCAKAVLPGMLHRGSGKIVNISSMAAKRAFPLRSPYAASKWGLIGLTLALAKEVGPRGIQVNAICPGPVRGARIQRVIERRASELGRPIVDVEAEMVEMTLLKRFVDPEDIAAMVAFLASAEGDNITGQALEVSAGYAL